MHNWRIPGARGEPIYGTAHRPEGEPAGVLLICHGFKGYKEYGLLPHLARAATRYGLIAHRFNFSHSGVTPNHETFERPDLFERDTWGKQIEDLRLVAAAIRHGVLAGRDRPMIWFGHSRGGTSVILTAGRVFDSLAGANPGEESAVPPAGVITASAPAEATAPLLEDQKAMLRELGRLPSPSHRTGQELYVGREWLAEVERNPAAFDPLLAAGRIRCPMLIVHGEEDETVAPAAAEGLARAAGERARVHWIARASHTFNAPNPLPLEDTPPTATTELIDACCDFARQCCSA